MTHDRTSAKFRDSQTLFAQPATSSHYALLGVHPSASVRDIRQAYRDLSKLYHPDTTNLPAAIATAKFQQLNEAYATLSQPERRIAYDRTIGYSRVPVIQPLPSLHQSPMPARPYQSSAYLDPTDRPLSPGEIFALFILALTFIGCLALAIAIGLTRGDAVSPTVPAILLSLLRLG
ncbi:J domain-containing protein [Pantanalinema sp. GBBB05]|uniref:J domain-containing protein n=1 Tax=Pantanalinema sp. GBBB05 TaxID=2604139 RepID=UPI001D96575B|nr:J domain-containing protein [Pantanalinema sp. GBBB05]